MIGANKFCLNSLKVTGVTTRCSISTLSAANFYHPLSTMNILYIALLLCMICHVLASGSETSVSLSKRKTSLVPIGEDTVASSPEAQSFVGAVQRGDMDTAT